MANRRQREFAVEDAGIGYANLAESFRSARLMHADSSYTAESIELLLQEAEANRRLGRSGRAARLFNLALQFSSRSSFASGEAWALWGRGMLHRAWGLYNEARWNFRSAHASALRASDVRCVLWSRAELAETDRIAGNYRSAITAHRQIREDFHSIGDARGVLWATSGIAQMLRMTGSLTNAWDEFSTALDSSRSRGDVLSTAWSLRGLAEIAREQGKLEIALNVARDAIDHFGVLEYTLGKAYAQKTLADSLLAEGSVHEASALAEACSTSFLTSGEIRGIALSRLTLANVATASRDPKKAIINANEAARLMCRIAAPPPPGFDPCRLLERLSSTHRKLYESLILGGDR